MSLTPLPLYPYPLTPECLELLKAAKAQINTDVKIVPTEAVYGISSAVLCLGEIPPWIGNYILVKPENVGSIDSLRAALEHWLVDGVPTMDEAGWLSAVMGCDVTLLGEEPVEPKVMFA